METMNTTKHISGQFDTELENIRNQVLTMGGLVEKQLRDALKAIEENDIDLAKEVRKKDKQVNQLDLDIDQKCIQIIAKRQPAASDLRLMVAINKSTADLERIGDTAKKIAKVAMEGEYDKKQLQLIASLDSMGRHVSDMLNEVLDAFARMDVDAALKVHKEDKKVDREYEGILREMVTYMMEDSRAIPKVLEVMWAVRSLERIGDRCQNIAEYIVYCVKGKDIRHAPSAEIDDLLK
ncbi:phosphate signaling complex protein PhoU [Corallincola platygyrae]|uniref:Phosphate-specific transport system accessory protein PhoU n=1 Tax=Corallincola platygyrae TaxID=1193278 RepID=A0ABW4XIC2_9GAMM